jgi:hypothetical protein
MYNFHATLISHWASLCFKKTKKALFSRMGFVNTKSASEIGRMNEQSYNFQNAKQNCTAIIRPVNGQWG